MRRHLRQFKPPHAFWTFDNPHFKSQAMGNQRLKLETPTTKSCFLHRARKSLCTINLTWRDKQSLSASFSFSFYFCWFSCLCPWLRWRRVSRWRLRAWMGMSLEGLSLFPRGSLQGKRRTWGQNPVVGGVVLHSLEFSEGSRTPARALARDTDMLMAGISEFIHVPLFGKDEQLVPRLSCFCKNNMEVLIGGRTLSISAHIQLFLSSSFCWAM